MAKQPYKSIFEGVDTSDHEKLLEQVEELRRSIAGGLLDDLFQLDPQGDYEALKELFSTTDFDPEHLRRKLELAVEKVVRGSSSLKEAFGFSNESMEAFYFMGHAMFQRRNYPAARRVFEILTQFDPQEPRYYHALGATQHKQKDFLAAVRNYLLAFTYNPVSDPELQFHCADCYLKMDDLMSAIIALGHCIEACDDRYDMHRQMKTRSLTLRETLMQALAQREQARARVGDNQELLRRYALEKAASSSPVPSEP